MKKNTERKIQTGDFWVLILTLIISAFGVIMDFSASYYVALSKFNDPFYYLKDAAMWFILGWIIFLVASRFPINFFKKKLVSIVIIFVSFVLLGLLFTPLGLTLSNATRWIQIGPITIMPGEIAKTCFIFFFSWFFSDKPERIHDWKCLLLSFGILGFGFYLIFKQPNLSTALTAFCIGLLIMFIAGLSGRLIILAIGGMCVGGVFVFVAMKDSFQYMIDRITGFWNPFEDSLGSGYQVAQGLLAIGSGGFFGIGLGNSVQKAFYLPEPQSDFILAIIGEELGLCGILCVIFAYISLCYAIFSIANRAKDRYSCYFASGVGVHIGLQVILNIAVVTASMPATGIALPLITLGGSSTLLFMGELGLVYNISKHSKVV